MPYQEGGLAAAMGPPEEEEEEQIFAPQDPGGMTDYGISAEGILQTYKESAEQSRQALVEARERILAREYDPRQMWLQAAAAFGAPTRTGQFGETVGKVAGALAPEFGRRQQFEQAQEQQLSQVDQALAGVDQSLAGGQLQLFKLQEAQRAREQDLAISRNERREKEINQNLTHTAGMRKEFNTLLKDYEKVSDAYGRVQAAATDPSAAGDLAMIFNFMKMLDPGSTVREGEFATAAATAGVPGRIVTFYNNILAGERLNPDQRIDFLTKAESLYGTALEGAELKAESYRALATRNNLNPEDVITVFENARNRFDQISVPLANGGVLRFPAGTSQSVIDAEVATKNKELGFATGGRVRFQAGGSVGEYVPPEETDEDDEGRYVAPPGEEEEAGIELMDLLRTLGGAAAGAAAGPLAIEGEARLSEMAQGQLERGKPAERKIVEAMEMGGLEPAEVMLEARRGQRLGVPQRPIDVGGRMTGVLGEQALIAGGPEAEEALASLEERHAGSRERVGEQISRRFRTPEYFAQEDKLTNRLYENARPAYERAWNENPAVEMPPFWKRMVDNRYGEQAVHLALDFMDDIVGEPIGKTNIQGWVERPSLKFLDQVKRGFDQLIRREENMGATPLGRHLRQMRSQLVSFLDDPENVTPAYAAARRQYRGDLEILEALDTGRTQYLKMPTEEARRLVEDMPWSERNALRAGVTQRLYEQLDTPTTDINAARKILGSPGTSDKLALLFDKPKDFEVFQAALRREMELFEQGRRTTRRAESGRTRRMTGELMEQESFQPGAVLRLARNVRPVEWFMNFIDRKKFKLPADEADEIIRILNEGDLSELQAIGERLEKVKAAEVRRAGPRRGKGRAAMVGAGVGAALAAFGPSLFEDDEEMEEVGALLEGTE